MLVSYGKQSTESVKLARTAHWNGRLLVLWLVAKEASVGMQENSLRITRWQ